MAPVDPGTIEVDLVLAARRGDLLALSQLMDSLVPFVACICGGIALGRGDDAAQETLIQVLRDLRTLRDPSALRAFVRRIAVREAVRHARRGRAEARAAGDTAGLESSELPAATIDPGLSADVRAVLDALAPEQRAILLLRDLEGLSEQEAAEVLGVAKGTVKSRLFRAREAFARRWST